MEKKNEKQLLTLGDLAAALGVPVSAVRARASRGRLPVPVYQVGRRGWRYVRRVDVERLLGSGSQELSAA